MIAQNFRYWIFDKARNNKLIYSVVHYFRRKRSEHAFKLSLENFHKNGYESMKVFDSCMAKGHYPYSVAFGTLLGTVRNKDFIPHDDDIDVAMWINDFRPELIEDLKCAGFKLHHSFSIEDDKLGKELTFEYKGVLLDIFFFYKDADGKSYCCDFITQPGCSSISESIYKKGGLLPRKLILPLSYSLERACIRDIEVNIPTNYKEILSFRYGEDYMTPKKGWRPTTSCIIEMPDYVGVLKDV